MKKVIFGVIAATVSLASCSYFLLKDHFQEKMIEGETKRVLSGMDPDVLRSILNKSK